MKAVGFVRAFVKGPFRWALIAVPALVILRVATVFALQTGPRPLCHKALDCSFLTWSSANGNTNAYPNVRGESAASLLKIQSDWGPDAISKIYGYVPGLHFDDTNNLVLMYLKEQTAYTYHGDHDHTRFSPRKWMVLSPAMIESGNCPEGGELLDTAEFKRRLLATIDFLKTDNRPNWEVVAREQMAFLASINDQ